MLERIAARIALELLAWVDKRINQAPTAVDADPDRARLERAGRRIAEWLRESDDIRAGGKPDEGGPTR